MPQDGRLTRVLLGALIAAVLVASVAVAAGRPHRGGGGARADSAAVQALESVLPELIAFVEQARGLRFLRPPDVRLLSDSAFERLLRNDSPGEPGTGPAGDVYVGVLRALGLIAGRVDLDAIAEGEIDRIVGVYDDRTQILSVRGMAATPFVKLTLVHELTHALDDQHFNLDRRNLDDDASAAYTALVEGDALWVEARWYRSRPADEQASIDVENQAGNGGEPSIFERLFSFPYVVGRPFVDAVRAAGGQARLDASFSQPPLTTEQVLHPERFLAGEPARDVARPPAAGRVVDEGTLGEALLRLVLESAVDRAVAARAAAGWGGDRYVAWRSGSQFCVRLDIVMDTTQDTTELLSALRAWTAAHAGAAVRGASPLTVTNCA